jgi:DNA-binding NtrC family response regulator
MRVFEIVVARGLGAGQRLAVEAERRRYVIGRGSDVDLPLLDRRVSRRHLEVEATPTGVRIRVCEGAARFLLNGEERDNAEAVPGDEILLGNTMLAVVERAPAPNPGRRATDARHATEVTEATEVHELLSGMAGEVQGLSAVFGLIESLDGARTRPDLEARVAEWAQRHARVDGVRIILADDAEIDEALRPHLAHSTELLVEPHPRGGSVVSAPAHVNPAGRVAFSLPFEAETISVQTRRMLALAGRVCALSLTQLRDAQSSEDDRQSLRQLAIGSARVFSGESPAARQLATLITRLAAADSSVLLVGETGSGKSFVARLLHESSARAREPFRVINCAAIPENLLESELFGHERGAFSGALATRVGALEAAGVGTVVLDEIGELPLASQAKLLRVLEDKRFERIGSNRELTLRARVVAATNRDLAAMVEAGGFRRDLYFRISVVTVRVPPLRERGEDLVTLAERMLEDLAPSAGRRIAGFSAATLDVIRRYSWPGNVRELRNAIERAVVLGEDLRIEPGDLPEAIVAAAASTPHVVASVDGGDEGVSVRLPANLEWLEAKAIEAALAVTGGNRTRAAALLGIHRMTLFKKIREEPK